LGNAEPLQIEGMIADGAVKSQQAAVFEQQLELASELRLNVVIHERDAWDDTLEILRAYTGRLRAVFHCFGKSPEQAREVLALGHLVSFTGIATFKNAAVVHASAAEVPAGSFMLETDCPFLAPVPQRGKRCEPAHVRIIAEHIAGLRNVPLKQLAAETTMTAEQFFRLG
jgi:TatD DNase family protein